MPDLFYLRLGNKPQQQVSWLRVGTDTGSCVGTLDEAHQAAVGARIIVLAPANEMLCAQPVLPQIPSGRLRQALPYALEERFAEDVDALHFAIGKRGQDGEVPVVVVAKACMTSWQGLLRQHELQAHGMFDEALLLPREDSKWILLLEDEQALLRRGRHSGIGLPLDQLDAWLALAWDSDDVEAAAIVVHDARSKGGELPFVAPEGLALERRPCPDPLLLLTQGDTHQCLSLLCGEFSRREQLGRVWRPWQGVAALLMAWLLLQVGLAIDTRLRLVAEHERLYQEIEASYRQVFPEAVHVVNPRVQMERQLHDLRSGGGASRYISLMADAAPQLSRVEGLRLRNLRYRQGELELELELNSLAELDRLKGSLVDVGLRVDIRTATTRGERVEARLAIKGGAA